MAGPFLCAFCKAKSSKKHTGCAAPNGAKLSAKVSKGFKWVVRSCCLCADSRFAEPRKFPEKGFNCCGAKMSLRCAESRFAEPRCSLQRERVVTFCVVQKVTKKHTGRSPATSIQSSVGSEFAKFSGGTCRNRFCLQNAGVKALNRCERVTVVQTQD